MMGMAGDMKEIIKGVFRYVREAMQQLASCPSCLCITHRGIGAGAGTGSCFRRRKRRDAFLLVNYVAIKQIGLVEEGHC